MHGYNSDHYQNFENNLCLEEGWAGINIKSWWDFVMPDVQTNLPSKKLTRVELKDLCSDSSYNDEECMGAVMAWGGQNRKHGQTLFGRKDEVLPIISKMRCGAIDHLDAYREFDQIWQKDEPLGMGAAYFTKLIFFCEPSHKGFIMDQWTSKSTNLLCDEKVIHLIQGHVSKKNSYETYERFCNVVEDIAHDLNKPAEHVEMAMFSKGGRNKAPWRQYVVDNWNH